MSSLAFLAFLAFLALVLVYPAITLARWLKRRARLREFAARHGLRFRGILASDKYAPYMWFGKVASSVLLYNVMEGRWNDFDVALFDYPVRFQTHPIFTGVILSLPDDCTPAPGVVATEATFGSGPVFMETHVGYLLVCPLRPVAPDDLPGFLAFASSAARALDADAGNR